MRIAYRPEIDGLRAIAVLVVMLFHFGVPGFGGGFVGVDVFFVISGYLITRLISNEIATTGEFRFAEFYVRRIRRLFPALVCVLVVSALVAVVVLSPEHLKRFVREMMTAVLSVSNIFFFSQSGYFDVSKTYKALLHTWSLGVEEQFYLIWPVFLLFALRLPRRAMLSVFVGLGLCTLVAAEFWHDREAAFFLTPFRIYEFAIGAGLVWLERYQAPRLASEFVAVCGLAMIAAAAHLITPEMHFPGLLALIPTVGAALVIYARDASLAGLLTRNPVSVWIGKISYSLYLVHWPLFVFFFYVNYRPLTALDQCALVIGSLVLAVALHRFIEQPFRYPKSREGGTRRFAARVAAVGTSMLAFGGLVLLGQGWDWRLSPETANLLASARKQTVLQDACHHSYENVTPELQAKLDECFKERGTAVLILGDSHAIDLFAALASNSGTRHVVGLAGGGCRPVDPLNDCYFRELPGFLDRNKDKIDSIVFTQKGSYFLTDHKDLPVKLDVVEGTMEFLAKLASSGIETVWIGPQDEPNYEVEHFVPVATRPTVGDSFLRAENQYIDDVEDEIRKRLRESGVPVTYVSKLEAIGKLTPALFIVDGEYTYSDTNHWSAKGEALFGAMLMRNPTLRRIFFADQQGTSQ
jgi:peptidoglycan/LPS O-acetylase OafA/YrhL